MIVSVCFYCTPIDIESRRDPHTGIEKAGGHSAAAAE
jgi:hypothetical protein